MDPQTITKVETLLGKTKRRTAAYVNHGRWVINCPGVGCEASMQLSRGARVVALEFVFTGPGCVTCGQPINVVWPDEPGLVDAALAARPKERYRNWHPGETVDDLLGENSLAKEAGLI